MHSAEWLRGAVTALERQSLLGPVSMLEHFRSELAAAEARESRDPSAAEVKRAVDKAQWLYCSEHEWPRVEDIPLLCYALLYEHQRASSAAAVIEAAEKALEQILWYHETVTAMEGEAKAALALLAKWKEGKV